jgi:uncharacterized protein (DUF488 family)
VTIYTVGHSTRSLDEFLALLGAHGVTSLVDVRTVPRSRRHPHFGADRLATALLAAGVEYWHEPGLGGLRKPRPDSSNTAWRHAGFRGYADYMETPAFEGAVARLVERAQATARLAMMCAEAVWWRCHRQLIADALVARGLEVRHITSEARPAEHELTSFATVAAGRVRYRRLL